MKPYMERAAEVMQESRIAVMVLLSSDNSDMEMWALRPYALTHAKRTPPEEFAERKLRTVGVIGFAGLRTKCAFHEPLDDSTVQAISAAFLEYVRVFLGSNYTARVREQEIAEIAALEALWTLEDPRPN